MGDLIAVSGISELNIGETACDKEHPDPLPFVKIDEPTLSMNFMVNNSPFAGREGKYVLVRLQSGETRKVLGTCMATIGVVGNEDYELVNWGKAGRTRHLGVRPTNRGSVMNPNDHPHGGGEGKSPVGHAGPMTPWGKPALGYKTRKKKNRTNKLMVKRIN